VVDGESVGHSGSLPRFQNGPHPNRTSRVVSVDAVSPGHQLWPKAEETAAELAEIVRELRSLGTAVLKREKK
jgi:hypothetical protein